MGANIAGYFVDFPKAGVEKVVVMPSTPIKSLAFAWTITLAAKNKKRIHSQSMSHRAIFETTDSIS